MIGDTLFLKTLFTCDTCLKSLSEISVFSREDDVFLEIDTVCKRLEFTLVDMTFEYILPNNKSVKCFHCNIQRALERVNHGRTI